MKEVYPDYRKNGLDEVRSSLTISDKTILSKFIKFCSQTTTSKHAQQDMEARLLQARDIIGKPFESWSKEDLEHFSVILNNSKKTAWTKHGTMATFKRFVKYHFKDLNLLQNIKLKKQTKFNYRKINGDTLLTADEVEKLIRASETLRMKAFIMLLYESGARPQEIRLLRWRDIKFNDDIANVHIFATKTDTTRTIPVKEASIHLKRWKQEYCIPEVKDDYYIFPGRGEDERTGTRTYDPYTPMTGSAISKIFRQLTKRAGITRNIWPYLIRHSRLTALYTQLPEQIVKKFGGHTPDSDMPAIYSHISNNDVKDAMLEKIYHVEEITPAQKNEYEARIKELEEKYEFLSKALQDELAIGVVKLGVAVSQKPKQ